MEAPELAYGVPIVSVVRDDFCVPYPVEFIVKKKNHGLFHVKYQVLDVNGKLYLQVDGFQRNMQKMRIMHDAAGFPLLTMSEKVLTPNHRWTVHRGESSERNDLLFSLQRSYTFQMRSRLDVFLPTNINEDVSNFQIVECNSSQFYRIYKGKTVIAEVNYNFTWGSFCKGKENFRVKIYPGVDYAFVVALIVILNENDIVLVMAWLTHIEQQYMVLVHHKKLYPKMGITKTCLDEAIGFHTTNKAIQNTIKRKIWKTMNRKYSSA